jgi:hypothetical protein
MPRYYFDTHDGEALVEDDTGQELGGVEAACIVAQEALSDMVRDVLPDGNQRTIVVRVRDETGKTVVKAAVSVMVELEL